MAVALVTNAKFESTNTNGGNSNTVDTTGATLLVIALIDVDGSTTITDSKTNSWAVARAAQGAGPSVKLWYCKNPTVGSGHFFTAVGSGKSADLYMLAFSGTDTADDVDQSNATSYSFATPASPGSVTPSEDGEVLVTGASGDSASATITGGFTIVYQTNLAGSQHFGGGVAYLIQTTATSANPAWTTGAWTAASIATFKSGGLPDLEITITDNASYKKAMIEIV